MAYSSPFLFCLLLLIRCLHSVNATGTSDGSEQWGYVEVRPRAHMFWWLYRSPQRVHNGATPWPTVLWLQGGPGASGVGLGNFLEVGPSDTDLKPRNSTWLQKADLLFVDNPVGTGFSFVEDKSALVKTEEAAAIDLTTLLKALYNTNAKLQSSPLFVVAESYGGKYAVTLGLSIVKAINARELKLKFGGVVLGDSWISPEDFVFSWGPLLRDVSRLDVNRAEKSNSMAEQIKQEIANGQYKEATSTWNDLENFINANSNSVDFYNFLLDSDQDPVAATTSTVSFAMGISMKRYSRYLSSMASSSGDINELMNGVIREKLRIIPKNVRWGGQSDLVFSALSNDFMKPRIAGVDQLLSVGINVTVYNGQLWYLVITGIREPAEVVEGVPPILHWGSNARSMKRSQVKKKMVATQPKAMGEDLKRYIAERREHKPMLLKAEEEEKDKQPDDVPMLLKAEEEEKDKQPDAVPMLLKAEEGIVKTIEQDDVPMLLKAEEKEEDKTLEQDDVPQSSLPEESRSVTLLDLICATKGTEAWLQKLKWPALQTFNSVERKPVYCEGVEGTKGFVKSYQNLHFYWVLGAGHFVPVENPCLALKMLGDVTQSPLPS